MSIKRNRRKTRRARGEPDETYSPSVAMVEKMSNIASNAFDVVVIVEMGF